MKQWWGRLSSSRHDNDTTSHAQIEELPSESVNTFREDGKHIEFVWCRVICACIKK